LKLKNMRKSIADQANVPPYVVFPDKSLRDMAHARPCDLESFRVIDGVGDIKFEKYGQIFTSAIKDFCEGTGAEPNQPGAVEESIPDNALEQIYKINQEISSLNDKLKELTLVR